jgi:hypothetical protein
MECLWIISGGRAEYNRQESNWHLAGRVVAVAISDDGTHIPTYVRGEADDQV